MRQNSIPRVSTSILACPTRCFIWIIISQHSATDAAKTFGGATKGFRWGEACDLLCQDLLNAASADLFGCSYGGSITALYALGVDIVSSRLHALRDVL